MRTKENTNHSKNFWLRPKLFSFFRFYYNLRLFIILNKGGHEEEKNIKRRRYKQIHTHTFGNSVCNSALAKSENHNIECE